MQTHDEALTEQDLAWLRRHTNFHGAETVLGAVIFMLFLAITVLFAGIWLWGPSTTARDGQVRRAWPGGRGPDLQGTNAGVDVLDPAVCLSAGR
ncbi:hypothetical protein [Achromobacter ruhlandii]|uniref:hypothetical protein n=1 Tax=Achromobacter ruhlandii TaxID=72557 RepID=UPI001EEE78F2|nr:hypothetical protein [Achromobacter ruhlandii]